MRCPRCGRKNPDRLLFCNYCGADLHPGQSGRRYVTVLFFDLSGFTAYFHERGLDRSQEEVEGTLDLVRRIGARHGGEPVNHLGDGVHLVFGFRSRASQPAADALRAADEIVSAVEEGHRRGQFPLTGRAVVASGFVVELSQGGRPAFFGGPFITTNRMIVYAEPGEVLLDDDTRKLVPAVRARLKKRVEAKGIPEPLEIYRLEGFADPEEPPLAAPPRVGELLEERFAAADAGRAQVAVLVAPPAGGAAPAAEAFARRLAERGVRVLRLPPLRPGANLRGWLRRFAVENRLAGEIEALPLTAVERRALEGALGLAPPLEGGADPSGAVLRAVELLAREPVAFLVRDLHRAPDRLHGFLWGLARRGRGRVLVLGTAASGRYPGAIRLAPYGPEEAARRLRERLGEVSQEEAVRLAELTGGLPELLDRVEPGSGPDQVAALLQPHLDELGEDRDLLLLLSLLPEPISAGDVSPAAGGGTEAGLRRLVSEGYLRPEGEGLYRFAHPVYREAARKLVPAGRRRLWLGAIARQLAERGETERAAGLLREARLPGAAVGLLRAQAAREPDEAVRWLTLARSLAESEEQLTPVRLDLGEALLDSNPRRALEEVAGVGAPRARRIRGQALLRLGRIGPGMGELASYLRERPGDLDAWRAWLEHATPRDLEVLPPPRDRELLRETARVYERARDYPAAGRYLELLFQHQSGEEAANTAMQLAGLAWRGFDPRTSLSWIARALALAEEEPTRTLAEAIKASLLLDMGEITESREIVERLAGILPHLPPGEPFARSAGVRIRFLLETGSARQALAEANRYVESYPHPWLVAMRALAAAIAEEPELALNVSDRALAVEPDLHCRAYHHLARGLALAQKGLDARPEFKRATIAAHRAPNPYALFMGLSGLAFLNQEQNPRRTHQIANILQLRTKKHGFLPFHHLARLLKAEANLRAGKPAAHLLKFTSPFGSIEFWRRSLVVASGGQAEPMSREELEGHGVLGRFVWRSWQRVWTQRQR